MLAISGNLNPVVTDPVVTHTPCQGCDTQALIPLLAQGFARFDTQKRPSVRWRQTAGWLKRHSWDDLSWLWVCFSGVIIYFRPPHFNRQDIYIGVTELIVIGIFPSVVHQIEIYREKNGKSDSGRRILNMVGFFIFTAGHSMIVFHDEFLLYGVEQVFVPTALLITLTFFARGGLGGLTHKIERNLRQKASSDRLARQTLTMDIHFEPTWNIIKVVTGGKNYQHRSVLYMPGMARLHMLMRYLLSRRALGFFFDDKLEEMIRAGRFRIHQSRLAASKVRDAGWVFWMAYAAYENSKRWPLYPLMFAYIVYHALYVDFLAIALTIIHVRTDVIWSVYRSLFKEFIEHHPASPQDRIHHVPGESDLPWEGAA